MDANGTTTTTTSLSSNSTQSFQINADLLETLNRQKLAFKYIQRGVSFPRGLLSNSNSINNLLNSNSEKDLSKLPSLAPLFVRDKVLQFSSTPPAPKPAFTLIKPKTDSNQNFPIPIDYLVEQREKRIEAKVENRKQELLSLHELIDPAIQRRALIELKSLKLRQEQRKLRQQIQGVMRQGLALELAHSNASILRNPSNMKDIDISLELAASSFPNVDRTLSEKEFSKQLFLSTIVATHKAGIVVKLERQKAHQSLLKEFQTYYTSSAKRKQNERGKLKRKNKINKQLSLKYFCFEIFFII